MFGRRRNSDPFARMDDDDTVSEGDIGQRTGINPREVVHHGLEGVFDVRDDGATVRSVREYLRSTDTGGHGPRIERR